MNHSFAELCSHRFTPSGDERLVSITATSLIYLTIVQTFWKPWITAWLYFSSFLHPSLVWPLPIALWSLSRGIELVKHNLWLIWLLVLQRPLRSNRNHTCGVKLLRYRILCYGVGERSCSIMSLKDLQSGRQSVSAKHPSLSFSPRTCSHDAPTLREEISMLYFQSDVKV